MCITNNYSLSTEENSENKIRKDKHYTVFKNRNKIKNKTNLVTSRGARQSKPKSNDVRKLHK